MERRRKIGRGPAQAPSTRREAAATLFQTLRFAYSETLGKWPLADLAFGIRLLSRRQKNLPVASLFAGCNCVQLKGPAIMDELIYFLKLLDICMLFSKKSYRKFLQRACFSKEDVLSKAPKAKILKPAFTILRDKSSKCFLLIVRGMHSIKDVLTAATGTVVPFHHLVLHEGGVSKLVLGYAHCGMIAAARWIAKNATPCLLEAVQKHPDYNIKVVGNSLGGGIAALLTYVLREKIEFSSTSCVAFAPAACMTWDLAESGTPFITTVINGSDLVPSCSIASLDDLRSEIAASSWAGDMLDQFKPRGLLSVVHRSMHAFRSFLLCTSHRRTVPSKTQSAAHAGIKSSSSVFSWSCRGARRHSHRTFASPEDNAQDPRSSTVTLCDQELMPLDQIVDLSTKEEMPENELWFQLEMGESAVVKEMTQLEHNQLTLSNASETHRFFPPGRIVHIVAVPASNGESGENIITEQSVGIYETPRNLYGKIWLSPTMIKDHYMPMYKKMIRLMVDELKKDEDGCSSTLL